MKSLDQKIRLSCALGQVFNLVVLNADLLAKKFILAFDTLDVRSRDRSHLFYVGNVLGNRGRGDQILFTELRFDAPAVEMVFGAIALNASRRSGVAGMIIALGRFVDGESVFAVGGRRDKSRHVFRHALMISQPATSLRGYPHMRKGILARIGRHRPKLSEVL